MSKVIYVCSRGGLAPLTGEKLSGICWALSPDNTTPNAPEIVLGEGLALGVANPSGFISMNGTSLLLGQAFKGGEECWRPLSGLPQGSFCLFRSDADHVEIASDAVASLTVWYYFDRKIFIASNSQRAMVMFLGGFEFNEEVVPWVLSSATLGPGLSWDKRIKPLQPDASVVLDRRAWSLSEKESGSSTLHVEF